MRNAFSSHYSAAVPGHFISQQSIKKTSTKEPCGERIESYLQNLDLAFCGDVSQQFTERSAKGFSIVLERDDKNKAQSFLSCCASYLVIRQIVSVLGYDWLKTL